MSLTLPPDGVLATPPVELTPEPLHLDSRESSATVSRLFETYLERQGHALAVLDDPALTRLERARLATRMLQVLAGYRGRKPRDGDTGRPANPALSVAVMARRAQDIRALVNVDGPAVGMTDVEIKHEVATQLDLSWERLRQILTGELGGGAARRRAPSDRPAGRPRVSAGRPGVVEPSIAATTDDVSQEIPSTPEDLPRHAPPVPVQGVEGAGAALDSAAIASAAAGLVQEAKAIKDAMSGRDRTPQPGAPDPAPPQTMAQAWAAARTRN